MEKFLANEFCRLIQGVGKYRSKSEYFQVTNTIFFIHWDQVLDGSKVTYANLICDVRPLEAEKHRVQMTVGGNKLEYEGGPSLPTVSLLNTKIFFNSVISGAHTGARFCTADVKFIIYNHP